MGAPRKIPASITFSEAEDEVFFSIATIKADPDASDLVSLTDGWLDIIDAARLKDREARKAATEADASRIVANNRLDHACEKFGDELFLAVDKDRSSTRWVRFFSVSVSRFVRQALSKQVVRVRGWMEASDPVFEKHKNKLDTWSKAAGDALVQTRAVAMVRGEAWIAREQMAEDLTRERDGLHDALSARARERGLPRDWPDLFFRKQSRASSSREDAEGESPADEGSPADAG